MNNVSVENRIKQVRKSLNLNQVEFGLKLGISVGVISNIELHRNKSDISKNPICNLICSIFNVNPDWLLTGEGEMFIDSSNNTSLSSLQQEYNLSNDAMKIIHNFIQMNPDEQSSLIRSFKKLING